VNEGVRYEIFGRANGNPWFAGDFDEQIATQGPDRRRAHTADSRFVEFQRDAAGRLYPDIVSELVRDAARGIFRHDLGFVWQINAEAGAGCCRGGYGVYYDRHSATLAEQTITQPPFAALQFISGDPNGPGGRCRAPSCR